MNKLENNIFLIGFMGAGKSTIARLLKERLDCPLIEMDEQIVKEQGKSINDIFAQQGEEAFRDMESQLIYRISQGKAAVVSCGGGAVIREENVENMKKNGKIVFLTARPETILERVKKGKDRPLLNGHMNVEYISSMMEKRLPVYKKAADYEIATDDTNKAKIVDKIIEMCIK